MERETVKESVHFVKKQHQQQNVQSSGPGNCIRCGKSGHRSANCPYENLVCRKCHRRGHLQRMCRSTSRNPNPSNTHRSDKKHNTGVRQVEESEESKAEVDGLWLVEEVGAIHRLSQPPIKVPVHIDGVDVCMELDTGTSVSIVSETQYKQLWPGRSLDTSQIRLQTYSREPLVVVGSLNVIVEYEAQKVTLPLGGCATYCLVGTLNTIKLNWAKIHYTHAPGLNDLLAKYPEVFEKGLGIFKGQEVSIAVDPEAIQTAPLPHRRLLEMK